VFPPNKNNGEFAMSEPSAPPIGPEVDSAPAPRPSRTVLEGRLVRLEALDPKKHGDDLWAACGEGKRDGMWHYMGIGPFPDRASFDAYLDKAGKSEDPLFFAIVPKPEGRAAGIVTYLRIEPAHRVIEVGSLWYGESLQGSAASTDAMYLMARHAFEDLGYRRYEWKTNALNAASRKAAERLGFTYEGLFRNHMIMKGRSRDTAWFSMLEEEWPKVKRAFETYLSPDNFDGPRHKRSLPDIRNSLTETI
jgi:RimJ/RimL family protein N-acetyltransferase